MRTENPLKIFREVIIALMISGFAGLPGGSLLGIFEDYLLLVPGLMLIIPPTMGLRGNVYGALASRFSTSLHLGIRRASVKSEFYSTFGEVLLVSYFIPTFALVFSHIFKISIDILLFFVIMVCSAFLSGIILTLATIFIATASFKKGWNPDNVTSPVITTIGDIITIPTIFVSLIIALSIPLIIKIIIVLSSLVFIVRWFRYASTTRVVVMLACSFIGGLGGILLEMHISTIISTGIIILVPVFMDGAGNISSIFSSRLGTDYHLGTISRRRILSTGIIMFISALLTFILVSIAVFPLSSFLSLNYNLREVIYSMLVGTFVAAIGIALGPVVTILCTRANVDPDDVSIPIVTSACDLLSILVIALVFR